MLLDLPRRPGIYNCLLLAIFGGSYPGDEKQKLVVGIQVIRLSHTSSIHLPSIFIFTNLVMMSLEDLI